MNQRRPHTRALEALNGLRDDAKLHDDAKLRGGISLRRGTRLLAGTALLAVTALLPLAAQGQVTVRDFVLTGGVSGEAYQGNLSTVGAAIQDSTNQAAAMVAEVGARGDLLWRHRGVLRGSLSFDGGFRQFAARGFERRDYAPREWVGAVRGALYHPLNDRAGLDLFGGIRGREVEDRPPMPLYLQPGYAGVDGGIGIEMARNGSGSIRGALSVDRIDYFAPEFAPQVRLLDRESVTFELMGSRPIRGSLGGALGGAMGVQAFVALDLSRYPEQRTFDPDDPYRRDHTLRSGVDVFLQGDVLARVGVEGRVNRSNSRRPEYVAGTLDASVSAEVPGAMVATVFAAFTARRYAEASPFARLLPGEEANSASLAYLSLSRAVAPSTDGAVRLGWTRAETEIGGEFFQRFGVTVLVNYRPNLSR